MVYMSNRYKVISQWSGIARHGNFWVQEADIVDTHTGTVYVGGAQRVVDADMKPARRGKGGTIPFVGETAWMDAKRLAGDLLMKERYGR